MISSQAGKYLETLKHFFVRKWWSVSIYIRALIHFFKPKMKFTKNKKIQHAVRVHLRPLDL